MMRDARCLLLVTGCWLLDAVIAIRRPAEKQLDVGCRLSIHHSPLTTHHSIQCSLWTRNPANSFSDSFLLDNTAISSRCPFASSRNLFFNSSAHSSTLQSLNMRIVLSTLSDTVPSISLCNSFFCEAVAFSSACMRRNVFLLARIS